MALREAEIDAGIIAYFDVAILHGDDRVVHTGGRVERLGAGSQFACYQVAQEECFWVPLTGTYRFPRVSIDPSWVRNGYGALAAGRVWLQDGRNTYRGPKVAFVAASDGERPFINERPSITAHGLQRIRQAVRERGGAL